MHSAAGAIRRSEAWRTQLKQDATIDVAVDAAHPHHISHIHVGGLA